MNLFALSFRRLAALSALVIAGVLGGCASPSPLVQGPVSVRPVPPPSYAERTVTGGIYRGNMNNVALFSDQRKPQAIGDTIKIDISESLNASSVVNSVNSRDNSVTSKGPGTHSDSLGSLLKGLANMDVVASGSDSFTGKGNSQNTSTFQARISAYVINVLSNGNLVVAGERSMMFNGTLNTLRFSGVVNPLDIKAGGIVASGDVADAKTELTGSGGTADTASRSWLQKLLTDGLSVW
ncbi:flagellar basal body L-ring protein FlgH [Scleromatobacter humisilvae]|uniref:Flagellar basal body L-ring protein FlgH n=1 Tax=Scleromatobacter humisilvae TaxID=2897159 RepID=A0A9X1YIS6_9BURK|nr:flagellar basal body L-ring protein FlgH [Scleromatobacter humisilvae]MCK9686190.1 flagellar basal body L-ring protein FlgH [Scleromatobacter humisilvae]